MSHSRAIAVVVSSDADDDMEQRNLVIHQDYSREYLPRLFQDDASMTTLSLPNSSCGDVAMIALCDGLKHNLHITSINLDDNFISDEGAKLLAEALVENQSVVKISLQRNYIGAVGAEALARALESNNVVISCDLENQYDRGGEVTGWLEAKKEVENMTQLNTRPPSLKQAILSIKRKSAPAYLNLSRADAARLEYREFAHDAKEHLDDWAAEVLSAYMRHDRCVEHLDLSFHHIGDAGAFHIAEMLRWNRRLDKLNLQGNVVTVVGLDAIVDAIRSDNTSCRFVCLIKNLVAHQDIVRLERACVLNRQPLTLKPLLPRLVDNDATLTHLQLDVSASQRYFDDVTCRLLSDALRCNTSVTALELTHSSKVTEVGARFLADALCCNTSLLRLDVSWNASLLDGGCTAIVNALLDHPCVKSLSMRATGMGHKTVEPHLCALLKQNRSLTELDVSQNEGLQRSGKALLAAAQHNEVLLDLHLEGCGVSQHVLDDLVERRRLNQEPKHVRETVAHLFANAANVKRVALSGKSAGATKLTDESIRLVAEALEVNFTAPDIDLSHNQMTLLGSMYVAHALQENRTCAVRVDLSYNAIAKKDVAEFGRIMCRVLSSHQTLQVLNLSGLGLTDDEVMRMATVFDTDHAYPTQSIILDDNPEVSDDAKFHLEVLIRFNGLLVRVKDALWPLWREWRRCFEELRPFPHKHLTLARLAPTADLSVPSEQSRLNAGAAVLCDMLRRIEGVTSVDFSDNWLTDDGIEHFVALLLDHRPANHTQLVELSLAKNQTTDVGASRLKLAAEQNLQLRKLDVSGCTAISPAALQALKRTVLYNCQPLAVQQLLVRTSNDDSTLTALDFSRQKGDGSSTGDAMLRLSEPLSDDQALLFCDGIERNTHITVVDVSHAHLTWRSVDVLLRVLHDRMPFLALKKVVLRNLMLAEDDSGPLCEGIRRLLIRNEELHAKQLIGSPITHVDISCNVISTDDVPVLVEGIAAHRSLEFFGIANSGLGETDTLRVFLSVAKNKKKQSDEASGGVTRDVLGEIRSWMRTCGCRDGSDRGSEVTCGGCGEGCFDYSHGLLNHISAMDLCGLMMSKGPTCGAHITKLDMSYNELNDTCMCHCLTVLARNRVLQELCISDNVLGAATVEVLTSTFFPTNSTLKVLDLRRNVALHAAVDALQKLEATILDVNDSIVRIYISDEEDLMAAGDRKRKELLGHGTSSPPQTPLLASTTSRPSSAQFSGNGTRLVENRTSSAPAPVLSALRKLKIFFEDALTLNEQLPIKKILAAIRRNDPYVTAIVARVGAANEGTTAAPVPGKHNDYGCRLISTALALNTHVTTVDLSWGLITDSGATSIASALMVNRSVTTLNLTGNYVGDEGATALASVLQVNPVLTSIDFASPSMKLSAETLHLWKNIVVHNDTVSSVQCTLPSAVSPRASASLKPSSTISSAESRRAVSGKRKNTSVEDPEEAKRQSALAQLRLATALNHRPRLLKHFLRGAADCIISELDCSDATASGRIFDVVACELLCDALQSNPFVTRVNLSRNGIDETSARKIAETIVANNVSISSLDLSGNPLIGDGAVALLDALITNHSLISLKLDGCNAPPLTADKIQLFLNLNREPMPLKKEVIQILKKDEGHTHANFSGQLVRDGGYERIPGLPGNANRKLRMDDESVDLVCGVLRADLIIRSIDCSLNSITDSGFHSLIGLTKRNKGIRHLNVSGNLITGASVRLFASQPTLLESLDVSGNTGMQEPDIPELFVHALRHNTQLTQIQVHGNRVSHQGLDAIEFFSRLNRGCSPELRSLILEVYDAKPGLTILDMSSFYSCGHWVKDGSTMQLLTYALRTQASARLITTLHLEFNDITDVQFRVLCLALQTCSSISHLNLANNLITDISSFTEGSAFNVTTLSLRQNQLGVSAARDLATLLRSPTVPLTDLDVSHNAWGRAGASILLSALPMNRSLKVIEIEGDGVSTEVVERAKFAISLEYWRDDEAEGPFAMSTSSF